MQSLTRTQVQTLNAFTRPADILERFWACRKDGSRGQVVKVTRTHVYFENTHDCTLWSEPISAFEAFKVLKLTTVIDCAAFVSLKTHRLICDKTGRALRLGSRVYDDQGVQSAIIDIDLEGRLHIEETKSGLSYDLVEARHVGAKWIERT